MNEEKKYWIGFSRINNFGPAKFERLRKYFDENLEEAWKADLSELIKAGLDPKITSEVGLKRNELDLAEELGKLAAEDIKVTTIIDDDYPKLLKEIYNPPALLYYKGNLSISEDEFTITVVGSRNLTAYGKQVIMDIVPELAKHGITIVSGLAIGVDGLAHEATLSVQGRTLAVLGSGVDSQSIYPSRNRYVAGEILKHGGAVISEFPLGTQAMPFNFPIRNRILAGLSLGTVVIEATEKSGSLITAKHALEFNREIFAVPGNIYNENSTGPNRLIKMGAKTVTSAQDILEALDLSEATNYIETKKIVPDSQEEEKLLRALSREPIHIDELTRKSGMAAPLVSSTLVLMEMKGKVRNLGNSMYVVAR